jgi:thiosulfate reductase cytochrome b subunit
VKASTVALLATGTTLIAAAGIEHIHPSFPLLDERGNQVMDPAGDVSEARTCGECHDADYIEAHSSHLERGVEVTCLDCHLPGGPESIRPGDLDADGLLTRPMQAPGCEACGECHGLVHRDELYFELPPELLQGEEQSAYGQTLMTGEVYSPQDLVFSHVDLRGKQALDRPWDVHAASGVHCATCHTPANSPFAPGSGSSDLAHLSWDPRRLDLSTYLRKPDHRLVSAGCTSCHDADASHDTLPYPRRHVRSLACQACHVPVLMGPALEYADRTVVTAAGGPRMGFRNVDTRRGPRTPNTWYYRGYSPVLLHESGGGAGILAPYNLVTTWRWISGKGGDPVDDDVVARAFKQDDGRWHPEILEALDGDGDGRLGAGEIVLDTRRKVDVVAGRLATLGVASPRIEGVITSHPIRHSVVSGSWVEQDCSSCHADSSRLNETVELARGPLPGGVTPTPDEETASLLGGRTVQAGDGVILLVGDVEPRGHYVLGHSRRPWSDWLGFVLFVLTVLGVAVHGTMRVLRRRSGTGHASGRGKRVYMYAMYERIWHWTMALSIIVLLVTGFQIHFPALQIVLAFPGIVLVHNFAAAVLLINAFLGMFFHLSTGEIRQFIPERAGLLRRVGLQVWYYGKGIFVGASHPFTKTRQNKLNPLQQFTYAGLLNFLFPFQVVTGILLIMAGRLPEQVVAFGGLAVLAPLHNLGSWLFLSFLVLHVYLTTTGETPTSNTRAMLTGWETTTESSPDDTEDRAHG